ncbi:MULTISPECIES: hypothetical protein [Ralstonia]|jgi:hypothetical protein|uniref:Uncharacterized protein n=2 Tax=Ralstonia TaxID=48736 RepID=A0AAD2BLT8_9RALS|nr:MULTISPECIES: hypothetical protein [unclassified Ralstonia]ENZ76656.1 hypothetical protein OR214_03395 [Ralstonia pickettii OR214]MEA3267872.1 hypothetical protein [Pseudomonadota bacterium]MDR9384852.1 hypothetical protein [Ralstonia sp. 11b]CAJ0707747.1 hypothetical protein LMG7143_00513 [Ralstonia sp. LMG 18095]CAJ0778050.1 hypothetical protein LMG18095_00377 [Ralstonia sp. LMG 18095]
MTTNKLINRNRRNLFIGSPHESFNGREARAFVSHVAQRLNELGTSTNGNRQTFGS